MEYLSKVFSLLTLLEIVLTNLSLNTIKITLIQNIMKDFLYSKAITFLQTSIILKSIINITSLTYQLEINRFTDLTIDEFIQYYSGYEDSYS